MESDHVSDSMADDSTCLDSVPDELRTAYWYYRNEANSEHTLSGKDWMRWRELGTGKAETFLQREINNELERSM